MVADQAEAAAHGLIDDPYEAFNNMSEAEQNRVFAKAGARAIRDGADIFQVVNARRHMAYRGAFTNEGITRFGWAGQLLRRSTV